MRKLVILFVLAALFIPRIQGQPVVQEKDYVAYLFTYFTGNHISREAVCYAVSTDGYSYWALNNNQPVLDSKVISSTGGVRDPHILRCEDGKTFYMVLTDMVSDNGWDSNRAIVLLKSNDLVNWSHSVVNMQKRYTGQEKLKRVWAPQTVYDPQIGKYMVYWSMKHGNGPDIIYYAYANKDFTDLEGEPKPLFIPENKLSCIDGDIVYKNSTFYLFYKTEGSGNGIKLATTQSLTSGKWNEEPDYKQQTKDAVEGAGTFKLINQDKYILMYDVYMKGAYQFTETTDLKNFRVIDQDVKMDFHPRHGTIIPITRSELKRITDKWGCPTELNKDMVSITKNTVMPSAQPSEKKMLTGNYSPDALEQSLCIPQTFTFVPRIGDTYWRDSIPEVMRQSYIRAGEQYIHKEWATLPVTVFSRFRSDGVRVDYENISFARRRQFATLVMAELMEDKGRFLPDIINGIWVVCEETWWGIPAHYGPKVTLPEDQNVDLFQAETAGMMAWAGYVLKDRLDAFSPFIFQRMTKEIERRFLTPALEKPYGWKKNTSNWNPWICSNWLSCVLLCEADRSRQLRAVQDIMGCLDYYIDSAPDDGGCNEGPSYWTHAAGSLGQCLVLLRQATGGKIDLSEKAKVKALGSFLYKTYIGKGCAVNFADASMHASTEVNIVYPFSCYLNDAVMAQYAAWVARKENLFTDPGTVYHSANNYPSIGHELLMLNNLSGFLKTEPHEPLIADAWLPHLQVMASRSVAGSTNGLFFAAKGGYNAENHNHNDVGTYVIYADGDPLLIDVGVGTYTAQTFGADRYQIWTMQSGYHNLPIINGTDQKDGAQYKAKDVQYSQKGKQVYFSLDIAGAYPAEAAVESWKRTFRFTKGKQLTVREEYRLKEYKAPQEIVFMTCCHPEIVPEGISLRTASGQRMIVFDTSVCTPQIEPITITDERLLRSWKPDMWRIRLQLNSRSEKGIMEYHIL